MSAKIQAMAAKKRTGRTRSDRPSGGTEGGGVEGVDAVRLIAEALAGHEAAIRQLAEVVVNLHANIGAIRDVVDALAEGAKDPRVVAAKGRLKRVKLQD
jgi:hypothetical protein